MAAEAAQYQYADPVYGNVAYDPNVQALPRSAERERTLERPKELTRESQKTQTTFGLPILAVFGCIAVAVLVVFLLLGYVELTELSADKQVLEKEISELTQQNDRLKVTYEQTFNMSEVERYAINVLGMTKLSEKETSVIRLDKADKAEILGVDDSRKGILDTLSELVEAISEYFG